MDYAMAGGPTLIYYDVGVKRSFDPYDTGLFRASQSHKPQKHS